LQVSRQRWLGQPSTLPSTGRSQVFKREQYPRSGQQQRHKKLNLQQWQATFGTRHHVLIAYADQIRAVDQPQDLPGARPSRVLPMRLGSRRGINGLF
jgi:hypothetical protein